MIRRDRRVPTARRVYDFYWDGDDRLRKVTYTGALPDPPETWPNPAATERFRATYDAGGIRASAWDFWKGQHNYTWSAFGIVHDTNTNRTFTPGLAQRRGDPAEDKFIHADHIGSTRWLSKMDGTFPNGLRYTAYGQKAWQTGGDWQPVDFLFAGECGYITEYSDEQNPGVALLYLQQRYYDPDIGRFLTPDPIGFAGGLNLYAYCGNDPVNNVDPDGTAVETPWDVLIAAADSGIIIWDYISGASSKKKAADWVALAWDAAAIPALGIPGGAGRLGAMAAAHGNQVVTGAKVATGVLREERAVSTTVRAVGPALAQAVSGGGSAPAQSASGGSAAKSGPPRIRHFRYTAPKAKCARLIKRFRGNRPTKYLRDRNTKKIIGEMTLDGQRVIRYPHKDPGLPRPHYNLENKAANSNLHLIIE